MKSHLHQNNGKNDDETKLINEKNESNGCVFPISHNNMK